jgi:cyanophycinase
VNFARRFVSTLLVATATVTFVSASLLGQERKGHLVIIGGGERTGVIMERFVELAGGKEKARIIILPMASSVPDTTGMEQTEELKALGVKDVHWLMFTREQAMKGEVTAEIAKATGIFFSGGDQARIAAVIVGTPVEAQLKALYRGGAVVGGTSAGAAIMSRVMITGNERINKDSTDSFVSIEKGNVETIDGIGFLEDVIIDQHFIKRKRLNRLISVVLEHPKLPGIGIDESTAIQVNPDRTFEVIGEGTVVIVDATSVQSVHTDTHGNLAGSGMRMHILASGDRFNLKTRSPQSGAPRK